MTSHSTTPCLPQSEIETTGQLFDNWFDPIEAGLRDRAREFLQALLEAELDEVLARSRYARRAKPSSGDSEEAADVSGHRHGHRSRSLLGTFGKVEIAVPRARLNTPDGKTTEWKSRTLRAYQRRTLAADALIARLILDGTVVRVRLDRKATAISLLVVIGVRGDGQKILLAIKAMGGESTEAWRAVLDDLILRGLQRPEFLIVDGAPGLENAIAAVWDGVPVQRCTVHKHRNLLAHAPERLHEEISADYNDMIYAATREEIEARRKAFIRKWRLKHRAVADSLQEEFKRRIKTQTVLPSADTAAMLFWALLASGQINMRKVDGWQTLATKPIDQQIDLAA